MRCSARWTSASGGYGWLTVLAEELGERLGGLEVLRASGAFVQVDRLASGGFWLLATRTWDEYGWPEAEGLFEVVAPVLPPGRPEVPREKSTVMGQPPVSWRSRNMVVERDPAEITG
jgi:hypothetical protein